MERRGRKKNSEVDATFQKLAVGQSTPVRGSISYWRNRQAIFHQKNPDKWVAVRVVKKKGIAVREL